MSTIEETPKTGLAPAEKGVIYAVCAHLTWGAMAVYFGFMRHINPMEIAVHRGLWSIPCAAIIIWWLGQYRDVLKAIASPRNEASLTQEFEMVRQERWLYPQRAGEDIKRAVVRHQFPHHRKAGVVRQQFQLCDAHRV